MSKKECRKFRADLRGGENLNRAEKHIANCPECRKAIEATLNDKDTSYKGENVEQVLKNAIPKKRYSFFDL